MLRAAKQLSDLKGFHPDQLGEVVRGSRLEHFLLGGVTCSVTHERWICGSLSIDTGFYNFPVRVLGDFPADRICIGLLRRDTPTWINGHHAGRNTLQLYPRGCELNYRAAADGEWIAILIDPGELQAAARARGEWDLRLPADGVTNHHLSEEAFMTLDHAIRRLTSREQVARSEVEAFTGLLAELLVELLSGGQERLGKRWQSRWRLLRKADRHLISRIGSGFDGRALAAAVGATERTIQRAFSEAYGVTPREWARCLALNKAHRLLHGDEHRDLPVKWVAREVGFAHVGRFAEYYRQLFGELPSEAG